MSDMRADDTSDPKGWAFLWWGLGITFAVLTLFYGAYRYVLHYRVEQKFASLEAQGYATTVEDLRQMYSYPEDGPNAADLYLEAAEKMVAVTEEDEDVVPELGFASLPGPDEQLSEEMKKTVRRYLNKNRESLDLLHRAAEVKIGRYPIDLSDGQEIQLGHCSKLRESARLLKLNAVFHARFGDTNRSVESVRVILHLAGSLRNEPLLISQVLRFACNMIALDGFASVLNHVALSEKQAKDWHALLQKTEASIGLKRALEGAIVIDGRDLFQRPPSQMLKWLPRRDWNRWKMGIYVFSGARKLDQLQYLDSIESFLAVEERPVSKRMKVYTSRTTAGSYPFYCPISRYVFPALERAGGEELKVIARFREARMALAVERFQTDNGNLPGELQQLVSKYADKVLTDPFTGKSLKYTTKDNGYMIYSPGRDQKDDGGDGLKDVSFRVGYSDGDCE